MSNKKIYITVVGIDENYQAKRLKPGDKLSLIKDLENDYDDEAIAIYDEDLDKCGYVANSIYTVARGTLSAGRLYDRVSDYDTCVVRFISEKQLIAEMN